LPKAALKFPIARNCVTPRKGPRHQGGVFQSAHPEIWICHYDTNLLKDISTEAVSRDEAELLDLQSVLERVRRVPQATIAKLESFVRDGDHKFALACDMRFDARGKFKLIQME